MAENEDTESLHHPNNTHFMQKLHCNNVTMFITCFHNRTVTYLIEKFESVCVNFFGDFVWLFVRMVVSVSCETKSSSSEI